MSPGLGPALLAFLLWVFEVSGLSSCVVSRMPESHKPLEPREGEARQTNKAYWGLLRAIWAY